jgi:LPS-assembly protein
MRPVPLSRRALAALLAATATLAAPQGATAQAMADLVEPGEVIEFVAETLEYDEAAQVVTARGEVVVARGGYRLRADMVVWNRATGMVSAQGDVVVIDPEGAQATGDRMEVSETLKEAVIDNLLIVLADGSRMAARRGERGEAVTTLERAVYSPCAVTDECGPVTPLWRVKAVRVTYDPARGRIFYRDAWFEFAGRPLLYLPRLSHPDGSGRKAPGLLEPDVRIDRALGLVIAAPYYLPLKPHNDLTLTPHLFSNAYPMLGADYRHLFDEGAIRVGGLVTYARATPGDDVITQGSERDRTIRGYFGANGRFQHDARWRSSFGVRIASDDTFLRRYDVSQDDVLRSFARIEQFGARSHFSAEAWGFQGLRIFDDAGRLPVVLPLVEYRLRPDLRPLGGSIELLGNALVVTRANGQDNQRMLGQVRWHRTDTLPLGVRLGVTGQLRGDLYHSGPRGLAPNPDYLGRPGWNGRFIPLAAVDVTWPLAGPALGGIQTLTPRLQLVASPFVENADIPNEDARAIDLEQINLFSLNRFNGYDRWEGGARLTWGLTWTLDRSRLAVLAEVGQSYRLDEAADLFPSGTGLTRDVSDMVGRTRLRFGRFLDVTHRFRLDQRNLALRRNEIDVTAGGRGSYVQLAWTRLNRDIAVEDLRDREEVRAAARIAIARYWSAHGAVIIDLTSQGEDPLSRGDGFEPIRHRLGFSYDDECFTFGLTWRRDYVSDRDDRAGSSFIVRIAFRNLGRQGVAPGAPAR